MFIEVTLVDGTRCMVGIDSIAYCFERRNGYCTIVLSRDAITLETNVSYSEVKKLIYMELTK